MSNEQRGPDSTVNSDRGTGSTPPETGPESASVVGRPAVEKPKTAFHEPAETAAEERQQLTEDEALEKGGSFDGVPPAVGPGTGSGA